MDMGESEYRPSLGEESRAIRLKIRCQTNHKNFKSVIFATSGTQKAPLTIRSIVFL